MVRGARETEIGGVRVKAIDMTGKWFGQLQVIKATERKDARGNKFWACRCNICGRLVEIRGNNLRSRDMTQCSYCGGKGARSRELL